jgi:hypothetical protein
MERLDRTPVIRIFLPCKKAISTPMGLYRKNGIVNALAPALQV